MSFSAKTQEQQEAEHDELLADWDGACERAFTTADWVRHCPNCEAGWIEYTKWNEMFKRNYQYARECSCFMEHLKSVRGMRIAKQRYKGKNEVDPPEPDRRRLELW
jgi:hypothetical protein